MTTKQKTGMKYVSVRTLFFMVLFLGSFALINTILTFTFDLSVRVGTRFGPEAGDLIDIVLTDSVGMRTARKRMVERWETNAIMANRDHVTGERGPEENQEIYPRSISSKSLIIKIPNSTVGKIRDYKDIGADEIKLPNEKSGTYKQLNEDETDTESYDILGNLINDNNTNYTLKRRQDKCNSCFKHDFRYLIENDDICKEDAGRSEIILLILILTEHKNLEQRNALRETWLTYSKNNTGSVRYAFLLGEVSYSKLRNEILTENKHFRDIIKEDFVDSYTNLTYKTIMGFKWAATKCGKAKLVMKTDDDVFVNIPNVLKIVKKYKSILQANILGSCRSKTWPIRYKISKWYVPMNSYSMGEYPPYCSGTGYITSINVVKKIYQVSPHVPFFHLEDVYVSFCVQATGFHMKALPGFHRDPVKMDPCLLKGDDLVTAHDMNVTMLYLMWYTKCMQNL